ncbi:MAG: nicotinate (nicotinamide) nucleotide adenylyltransferase [Burkholderiaceae bacterium]
MPAARRIAIFGGAFDPPHVGHLALARAAGVALAFDELRLMPTGRSWQKPGQRTGATHRLAMARLAAAELPGAVVDDREVSRDGPTYTVETLRELRAEVGPLVSLILLLGSDQLHNLHTWWHHEELLTLANLAVTQREMTRLADFPPPVESLLEHHGRQALSGAAHGELVFFRMPATPVSSSRLRHALAGGEPVDALLPRSVLEYIRRHALYLASAQ